MIDQEFRKTRTILLRLVVLVVVSVFYRQLLFIAFDPTVAAASGVPARTLEYLLLGKPS